MINLFHFFKRLFATPAATGAGDWQQDPLTHPALRRMSPRALADLPFDRGPWLRPAADPDAVIWLGAGRRRRAGFRQRENETPVGIGDRNQCQA